MIYRTRIVKLTEIRVGVHLAAWLNIIKSWRQQNALGFFLKMFLPSADANVPFKYA